MGCTCNKAVVSKDEEQKLSEYNPVVTNIDQSIRFQSQISLYLENTRIDQLSSSKLYKKIYEPSITITRLKDRKDYERIISVLAILSHKDPSSLTTINPNSVNDTPQLHFPAYLLESPFDESNNNFSKYTNNKGYAKVLHLTQHGSLKKANYSYLYYVECKNKFTGPNLCNFHPFTQIKGYPRTRALTGLNFNIIRKVMKDVLYAIKYLHDRNIVHQNINAAQFQFTDTIQKLIDRDENSNYYRKSDHCSLVLKSYGDAYCFDPNDFGIKENNYNYNYKAKCERKWKKILKKYFRQKIRLPKYCSPEAAFNFALDEWMKDNYNDPNEEEVLIGIEQFTKRMKEEYDKQKRYLSQRGYKLDTIRYNPLRLFGMTWEKRYSKWKNYDTLPLLENDDFNKDLWQRYRERTPRMIKANDIWNVGILAHEALIGGSPFGGGFGDDVDITDAMVWEQIITREYYCKIEEDYPLIFTVE